MCDHCQYVGNCTLQGPEDRTCPFHYELYTEDIQVTKVEVAEERNQIIKVRTPERETTILVTEEDFRLIEYGAYQLEISIRTYIQTMFRIEGRKIKRNYSL